MSRLSEIADYKNTILARILDEQNICKAVYYNDTDFKDQPNLTDSQRYGLIFDRVYPFDFIPTSDDELKNKKTYITMSITNYRKAGSVYFHAGNIFIYVFTHKDLYRTAYPGCLRIDYLIDKVDELFNGERGIGMGKLEFVGMEEFRVNKDYMGSFLQYRPINKS